MLLIWLVQWRNAFGWLTGGSYFAAFFVAAKMGRFRPRVNLFIYASGKAQGSKPVKGEGICRSRFSFGFGWMTLAIGFFANFSPPRFTA